MARSSRNPAHLVGPALPEIDLIEVLLQNLLLRQGSVQADGQDGLLHLPPQRALLIKITHSGQLLGECAATLHNVPAPRVGPRSPHNRTHIYSMMLIEIGR